MKRRPRGGVRVRLAGSSQFAQHNTYYRPGLPPGRGSTGDLDRRPAQRLDRLSIRPECAIFAKRSGSGGTADASSVDDCSSRGRPQPLEAELEDHLREAEPRRTRRRFALGWTDLAGVPAPSAGASRALSKRTTFVVPASRPHDGRISGDSVRGHSPRLIDHADGSDGGLSPNRPRCRWNAPGARQRRRSAGPEGSRDVDLPRWRSLRVEPATVARTLGWTFLSLCFLSRPAPATRGGGRARVPPRRGGRGGDSIRSPPLRRRSASAAAPGAPSPSRRGEDPRRSRYDCVASARPTAVNLGGRWTVIARRADPEAARGSTTSRSRAAWRMAEDAVDFIRPGPRALRTATPAGSRRAATAPLSVRSARLEGARGPRVGRRDAPASPGPRGSQPGRLEAPLAFRSRSS